MPSSTKLRLLPAFTILISLMSTPIALMSTPIALIENHTNANKIEGVKTMTRTSQQTVRQPTVAGMFYPGKAGELSKTLENLFSKAGQGPVAGESRTVGLIVPHAGYVYSGLMAAKTYLAIKGRSDIDRVILIGAHHRHPAKGATVPRAQAYATPLGEVPVDPCVAGLPEKGPFYFFEETDHSLEVQLPFLQKLLQKPFTIVPVLLGMADDATLAKVAEVLKELVGDHTLIVASSDFTHYGYRFGYLPFSSSIPENLKTLDMGAVDRILALDETGFADYVAKTGATICGEKAIRVLMKMVGKQKVSASFAGYDTSGAMTGDFENSVSYVGIVFRLNRSRP